MNVIWGLLLNEVLERKWAESLGHTWSLFTGRLGGWVLFSHGICWVFSDFLCLKWKFLVEIMICGPTFAKDNVSFYIASHQTNLQRPNYQVSTEKQCQAAYSDQQFWFLAFLPGRLQSRAVCASNGQAALDPLFQGTGPQPLESFHFSVKVF